MKTCLLIVLISIPSLGHSGFVESSEDLTKKERVFVGDTHIETWVQISKNTYAKRIDELSSPDYGYMSLLGQMFYIYNNSKRKTAFVGGSLIAEFKDLNGDGFRDLIISGMVDYRGDSDFSVGCRKDVVFIYLCDSKLEKYILKYKKSDFDIEVENDPHLQWMNKRVSTAMPPAL